MKLTKLELSGFKSFADTVTLSFGDGVTAIVGPNGCGKSNVSDAVRWVLGEQSARLLRGGKMEDVIFQGSAGRRPVSLTEVSLHLDNSDGDLPIAYQEVVVTRRLSRSGLSEYLLNGATVRLRDIQDLLRGTGLGSDAGVVIEAKMIDLLLSDRAEERRSLFEEAAGIGLYRDRKQSTERRLEETSVDLQRLEDLIAEVQSQIRSLARQKGKTERHGKLMEERFAVSVTLARRLLAELAARAEAAETRHRELSEALPTLRADLAEASAGQEHSARTRIRAEDHRAEIARQLAEVEVALSRLDGDIAVAGERLTNARARRQRDAEEHFQAARRIEEAARERESAAEELASAQRDHDEIRTQVDARARVEDDVRARLNALRQSVRENEEALAAFAETQRSQEGERRALEEEVAGLSERAQDAEGHVERLRSELGAAETRARQAAESAEAASAAALAAAERGERSRHLVAETREQEASQRNRKRLVEESLAQLTTRRAALEELERDRVGLAPGAAALLGARERLNGAVLGPLSDFIATDRESAEIAERLLGEWMHAVLVRDAAAVEEIRRWHRESSPGPLVLLPADSGPRTIANGTSPLEGRLRANEPAAAWVRMLLAGSEVLDEGGRTLRRASGAILLTTGSTSGPLRRRAEIGTLETEIAEQEAARTGIGAALEETERRMGEVEQTAAEALAGTERARESEREAILVREDAARAVQNLTRELADAETDLGRLRDRQARATSRRSELAAGLTEGEARRARLVEALAADRAGLTTLEGEQEAAREHRVQWQVQDAHVSARLRATQDRLARAGATIAAAEEAGRTLREEMNRLDEEIAGLEAQQTEWQALHRERSLALEGQRGAQAEAEATLAAAAQALTRAEQEVERLRAEVDVMAGEHHRLDLELTEVSGQKRRIVERVELEWRQPFEQLAAAAPELDLDLPTLEAEAERIAAALEAIGPVNPLALEEHAEETKRVTFLMSQRDDLVAARQSLLQAIKEIDGTARTLFLQTFSAVQENFKRVFQTLFGGGECELRLANPDDPLESEIDIHAAPRGKRTQRIHLLSSGERTLVAVSLLFSIYLTKPSPFCLMDEVDAPLDDANVGRFTTLLDEFKQGTQFVVITHNPRTMHAADAVYGVTMQEPGVSTIVGVRLAERAGVPAEVASGA